MGLGRNISHLLAALVNNRADFHRRWNDSATTAERWQGEWVSEANGHRGALRCLLTKTESGVFQASFHAVYAKFLTVCYTVPLRGQMSDGKLQLEGEADLGKLAGGVYHYHGTLVESAFNCTYQCAYDHGIFQLTPWRR